MGGAAGAPRLEHEVPSIGQELRPAVRLFLASRVECGHGRRGAAARARANDRRALVGREQDGAVGSLRTAIRRRRVGDFVEIPAWCTHRHENPSGEDVYLYSFADWPAQQALGQYFHEEL